jgi:hypothetical protein
LLALAGVVLALSAEGRSQLAAKSPFTAAPAAGAAAPAADNPLEFRGYMETGEGVQYRLYDPAKKAGVWVKLNARDPEFDVVAKQHDGKQETLTVEYQGRTLTLPVRKAKVVSSGNAAQAVPPPPVAQTNVPAAVTQAVVLNPTPADEQRRLDAVAAEVARRRALREQAAQQMGQGAAPAGAVPQAMPLPAPIPGAAPPQGYVSPTTQFGTRGRGPSPVSPR